MFNAETHFLSKQKSKKDETIGESLHIWLGNTPYLHKSRCPTPKEPKFPYDHITDESAEELHQLFTEYIKQLKTENKSVAIISVLYKMELIGVHISPIKHKQNILDASSLKRGVLVNETKNTLAIVYGGSVKVFPKAMYNFIIYVDGAKYFMIGMGLKSERRYSK
ncbi:hypothetical protein NEPAR04_2170 [Nematocida parisii]|nr:hypothetical protein NEPAR04_2170 [Nematocida parisii]